jgi:hypothetical protein
VLFRKRRHALDDAGSPRDLEAAIRLVAACPCETHGNQFLEALKASDILVVEAGPPPEYRRKDLDKYDVFTMPSWDIDGKVYWEAYPNMECAQRAHPEITWAEKRARLILGGVVAMKLDGLVCCCDDDVRTVATPVGIARLLDELDA